MESQYLYNMFHANRGRCVIINNKKFNDPELLSYRVGSARDEMNLKETFKQLGFEVNSHQNLTAAEMIDVMVSVAAMDHRDCDCLSVIILSHGDLGIVYGRDTLAVNIDHLMEPLKSSPTLAGKPKLFFIQSCRGKLLDEGIDETDSKIRDNTSKIRIPREADFLVMYSTAPRYSSWRDPGAGSWFVEALCGMLRQYGEEFELVRVLTRVNHQLALEYQSNVQSNPAVSGKKQVSSIVSMLTKELFFVPKPTKSLTITI